MRKMITVICVIGTILLSAGVSNASPETVLTEQHLSQTEMRQIASVYLYGVWQKSNGEKITITSDDMYIGEIDSTDAYGNCQFTVVDTCDYSEYQVNTWRDNNKIYLTIKYKDKDIISNAVKIEG